MFYVMNNISSKSWRRTTAQGAKDTLILKKNGKKLTCNVYKGVANMKSESPVA